MDIVAKHIPADANGVRIAALDEMKFRRELWSHRPLTDFWRVGRGTARKLEAHGMFTMGDVALCSEKNEELLYHLFGKNAELLIDHAWGWEPCTIAAIKAYKPSTNSLSSGQVLQCPYEAEKAKFVLREMADAPEKEQGFDQLDLFTDYAALEAEQEAERVSLDRERKLQEATLAIKKKFGKNAILKGMNLEAGATAKDRNARIGGHKA